MPRLCHEALCVMDRFGENPENGGQRRQPERARALQGWYMPKVEYGLSQKWQYIYVKRGLVTA